MLENLLLVSRHPAVSEWLALQGIQPAEHLYRVDHISQIKNRNVVGSMPFRFVVHTNIFGRILIPAAPDTYPAQLDYSCQEMIRYGAYIEWYQITRLRGLLGARPVPIQEFAQ